jgi:hypothetical protein
MASRCTDVASCLPSSAWWLRSRADRSLRDRRASSDQAIANWNVARRLRCPTSRRTVGWKRVRPFVNHSPQILAPEEKDFALASVSAARFRRAQSRIHVQQIPRPERRCEMDSRRRVPRHVAGWTGSCHIEGEPLDKRWDCRVLDISELGLAILLQHPEGTKLAGRRVSVESPTASTSVNLRLEGDVRNVVPVGDDGVRLGLEFVGLTELEQTVVRALGILNLTE